MYLQILTRCNMNCEHCGFSCDKNGIIGEFWQIVKNINFALEYDTECITIGGGEPLLHPRFFDILEICVESFDYIWLATNGSITEKMYRLAEILVDNDFYYQLDSMECTCGNIDDCTCEPDNFIQLKSENQIQVALSLDSFHSPIDENIERIWRKNATSFHRITPFEIRDVSHNIVNSGNAEKNNIANVFDSCICPDIFIKPNGEIKLCGCLDSPIIGHVNDGGIFENWEPVLNDDNYTDSNCFKGLSKKDINDYKNGLKKEE